MSANETMRTFNEYLKLRIHGYSGDDERVNETPIRVTTTSSSFQKELYYGLRLRIQPFTIVCTDRSGCRWLVVNHCTDSCSKRKRPHRRCIGQRARDGFGDALGPTDGGTTECSFRGLFAPSAAPRCECLSSTRCARQHLVPECSGSPKRQPTCQRSTPV